MSLEWRKKEEDGRRGVRYVLCVAGTEAHSLKAMKVVSVFQ